MREHAGFVALVGAAPIVVGGILVSVGIAQGTLAHPLGSPWFIWGLVVVGVGVAVELVAVGLYVGSRGTVAATGGVVTTTKRRVRVVLTLTPLQLTQPFHAGFTHVQAERMTAQYLGKLLKVSGIVKNVYPPGNTQMAVLLDRDELGDRGVFMFFKRRRWKTRLEALSLGTAITVVGTLLEIGPYDIKMKKCRLVNE